MSMYKSAAYFHLPPAARRADPTTSKESDRAITYSGSRGYDMKHAAFLVIRKPGSTSQELADYSKKSPEPMTNEKLHKRLPDAEKAGLVEKRESKICSITGHRAVTWWPKGYGE